MLLLGNFALIKVIKGSGRQHHCWAWRISWCKFRRLERWGVWMCMWVWWYVFGSISSRLILSKVRSLNQYKTEAGKQIYWDLILFKVNSFVYFLWHSQSYDLLLRGIVILKCECLESNRPEIRQQPNMRISPLIPTISFCSTINYSPNYPLKFLNQSRIKQLNPIPPLAITIHKILIKPPKTPINDWRTIYPVSPFLSTIHKKPQNLSSILLKTSPLYQKTQIIPPINNQKESYWKELKTTNNTKSTSMEPKNLKFIKIYLKKTHNQYHLQANH